MEQLDIERDFCMPFCKYSPEMMNKMKESGAQSTIFTSNTNSMPNYIFVKGSIQSSLSFNAVEVLKEKYCSKSTKKIPRKSASLVWNYFSKSENGKRCCIFCRMYLLICYS
ncbi:hypothetical protein Sjap_000555 [Stephania japonica]|uniref:Uncharacterized protein n=1 Tax=Stephania japonica TaxID=461633 RepID=A0AAP0KKV1_9MAGN